MLVIASTIVVIRVMISSRCLILFVCVEDHFWHSVLENYITSNRLAKWVWYWQ